MPGEALICIGCGPLPVRQGDFFSAGLHPWEVTGSDEESFRNLEQLLALPQVLAVLMVGGSGGHSQSFARLISSHPLVEMGARGNLM